MPQERLQISRYVSSKMLKDCDFSTEAKKLLDRDGNAYPIGDRLQKKLAATMTQPADVKKRITAILEEP